MARKFLICIASVIALFIAGAVTLSIFSQPLMRFAMVPWHDFDPAENPPAPDYSEWSAWAVGNPEVTSAAAQQPAGLVPEKIDGVAVFYIHPTSYFSKDGWNGAIDSERANRRLRHLFLKGQASAFRPVGEMYAPHYRQASLGAFLTKDVDNSLKAFQLAYADVAAAFDSFLERIGPDKPFMLVGHSQGAMHGLVLLNLKVAGTALQERMVAAYLVGWPISTDADLPASISPCQSPSDTGCVISWQSFGPEGDATEIFTAFESMPSLSGKPRNRSSMLCTNPLSWTTDTVTVSASANRGAVAHSGKGEPLGAPIPEAIGARCGEDGILYLTSRPEGALDHFVLPGDNYHMQDIQLFYVNVQQNAIHRAKTFLGTYLTASR